MLPVLVLSDNPNDVGLTDKLPSLTITEGISFPLDTPMLPVLVLSDNPNDVGLTDKLSSLTFTKVILSLSLMTSVLNNPKLPLNLRVRRILPVTTISTDSLIIKLLLMYSVELTPPVKVNSSLLLNLRVRPNVREAVKNLDIVTKELWLNIFVSVNLDERYIYSPLLSLIT
jgi:hypothetical protein